MAAKGGIDLEAFGKAKSGSGSPSKERGDCEHFLAPLPHLKYNTFQWDKAYRTKERAEIFSWVQFEICHFQYFVHAKLGVI